MKTLRNILITVTLIIATSVLAKTTPDRLDDFVYEADIIVFGTVTVEPKRSEGLYFCKRDLQGNHLWWDTTPVDYSATTNTLTVLMQLRDSLKSTNEYASDLISEQIWRHQYRWETSFAVSKTLKGYATTNITIFYGTPYTQDMPDKLEKGEQYTLFLQQRYPDTTMPDEFTLRSIVLAVSTNNEHEWLDRGITNKPTHIGFLRRIRELVKEQIEHNEASK